MKVKLFLLAPLFLVIVGCSSIFQSKNMSDADYRKLYYNYRALVTKAIKSNNEANLEQITDEYISKKGNIFYSITVSQLQPSGEWKVLLYKKTPLQLSSMASVHYGFSDKAHIYRGKDFVLVESNKIRNHTYKDNIHIHMVIKL